MEENKKRNPNSHECLDSWSELPLDLLNLVFKRLAFFYFHRAKSVCSSWLSASKQTVPKDNHTPWLILFPEEQNVSYCKLFNPEEKERLYRTQNTRLDFSKSVCRATYGTWLLMQGRYYNLYIVNLFTNESISLYQPPIDRPQLRMTNNVDEEWKHNGVDRIVSTVFWIDDKTKDYVVLCNVDNSHVVYESNQLNRCWIEIPETSKCYDMVYNDHRLYLLNFHGDFSIFDLRGETPLKTIQRVLKVVSVHNHQISSRLTIVATKLVATSLTGNVLVVQKMWRPVSRTWSFMVIKVCSSGNLMEHQLVSSLGNQSVLFDQGITVLANDTDGIIANSIYFSGEKDTKDIYRFSLKTNKMELAHRFDCSSVQFSRARWFVPSFTHYRCLIVNNVFL